MSEYLHVEKPFLDQLATLGWTVIDQGHGLIPSDPSTSLRGSFRSGCCRRPFARQFVYSISLRMDEFG